MLCTHLFHLWKLRLPPIFSDPKAYITFTLFKLLPFFLDYCVSRPRGMSELILYMGNQGSQKPVLCPGSHRLMWEKELLPLGSQTFIPCPLSPFPLSESMEDLQLSMWKSDLLIYIFYLFGCSEHLEGVQLVPRCQRIFEQLVRGGKVCNAGPEWNY